MDIVDLFEQLAYTAHHNVKNKELFDSFSIETKAAINTNDNESIKKQISPLEYYYANECHVVYIQS